MLGAMIQMFIGASYKGSMAQFDRDFNLFIAPGGEIIFAPKGDVRLPEGFKEKLNEMAEAMSFKPFYAESSNFEGFSTDEAQDSLNNELQERLEEFSGDVSVQVNAALFDVIAPEMKMDSEKGQLLIKNLSGLTGVVNLRIAFGDETYLNIPLEGEDAVEYQSPVNVKYAKLATGRPDRNTVISQDEQMNLKIALETQTIDEFIASM